MLNIDGLASGLDTTTIIEGLLSIQQQQVDRFNERKQAIEDEKAAFAEIETRLLSLQSTLSELSTPRTNAFLRKSISASDETVVEATVSNDAALGIYSMTVNQLARNHQIASNSFQSADASLADGTVTLSVGTGGQTHEIDLAADAGGTLEGLAEKINRDVSGVSASIIQHAGGYQLLLSSERTGAANAIAITVTAAAPGQQDEMPSFDLDNPVQAATDAEVQIGSGAGAIVVTNKTNQIDELFPGITMNLLKATPGETVQLSVKQDQTAAREAIESFVDAYNSVIEYTNEQSAFSTEDGTAATLFGNRSLRNIRDEVSLLVASAVPGLAATANGERFNRLASLGIRLNNDGTLEVNETRLSAVLNGEIDGFGSAQLNQLLGFNATSDHASIQFLSATPDTQPNEQDAPYGIVITSAATQATVLATDTLSNSIKINETNNELTLSIDGFSVSEDAPLVLTQGTYTREELASHLEQVIANSPALASREVRVSIVDNKLQVRSLSYGSGSRVSNFGGSAMETLGLKAEDADNGTDVAGHFTYVDDVSNKVITEAASGSGRILRGNRNNERTAGLSVRVTLSAAELKDESGSQKNVESSLNVTLGLAAQLNNLIERITDRTENREGEVAVAMREFDGRMEILDRSLDRLNAQFERQEQSLLRQFTNLETRISELQGLGSIVAAQLASLNAFGR